MKTALITGASGFIGSWVTKELLSRGVTVYAMVRPGGERFAVDLPRTGRLHVIPLEMADIERLPGLIPEPVQVCYHYAWQGVSGPEQSNAHVQLDNMNLTARLPAVLQGLGVETFIGAGSLFELELPIQLQTGIDLDKPNMVSKCAKLSIHYMLRDMLGACGIRFIWPLVGNVFGEGERSQRLINSTLRKLLRGEPPEFTSGTQIYSFIYIGDLARAFYLLGEAGRENRAYVLTAEAPRPLRQFLEEAGQAVAPDVPLHFASAPFKGVPLTAESFDNRALIEDTGFVLEVPFREAVMRTADWIKQEDEKRV